MVQTGEFTQPPSAKLWEQLATDPAIVDFELAIIDLAAIAGENFTASCQMDRYYWNTAVPCTTQRGGKQGDIISYFYSWDRPSDNHYVTTIGSPQYTKKEAEGRYLNDPIIEVVSERSVPGMDVKIILAGNGNSYLANGQGRALSAGYASIEHISGNDFAIPGYKDNGVLHLLTPEEQEIALEERQHAEAIHEVWRTRDASGGTSEKIRDEHEKIITNTLERYGIDTGALQVMRSTNAVEFDFDFAGKHVKLQAMNGSLGVMTWDGRLSHKERNDVWQAYESNHMEGVMLSMLSSYLDSEIPDYLEPYEDQIMADVDGINADKRAYVQHLCTFYERFGFLDFSISGDHVSWSLPIAMAFVAMPVSDSYPMVGKMQSEGSNSLVVIEPGLCMSRSEQRKLYFTIVADDEVRRLQAKNRLSDFPAQAQAVIMRLAEAKELAAKAAKHVMPMPPKSSYRTFVSKLLSKASEQDN